MGRSPGQHPPTLPPGTRELPRTQPSLLASAGKQSLHKVPGGCKSRRWPAPRGRQELIAGTLSAVPARQQLGAWQGFTGVLRRASGCVGRGSHSTHTACADNTVILSPYSSGLLEDIYTRPQISTAERQQSGAPIVTTN